MCVPWGRPREKTEKVAEVEAAIEKALLAITEAQPEDVRYASGENGGAISMAQLELENEEERDLFRRIPT